MSLNNKRVLITRPNEQAEYLSGLITSHGGISVRFPTVEIQPLDKTNELMKCFDEISSYDFIIFISRNAAKIAIEKFFKNFDLIKNIQLVAIGPSTAKILSSSNLENIIFPHNNVDSEGLLNLEEMQSNNIFEKKILIIRGVGGRELLAENLKQRGGNVNCIEIYERKLPEYGEREIKEAWYDNNPDAVVVTSNEVVNNLVVLLKNDTKKLFSTPLVTMSERIADYAKQKGFVSKIFVAKEKNDDGILTGLIELFGD